MANQIQCYSAMYMFHTNHVGHTGHSTIIISSYMKLENYFDAIVGVLQVAKQFGKVNVILRSQLVKVTKFSRLGFRR